MSPLMIPANMDMADILGDGFAANQIPVWDGDSFEPSSDYQRKYTNTVVVDAGGKGDFTSVKAACDYCAGLTGNKHIRVNVGTYVEQPFTVPASTIIEGVYPASHNIGVVGYSTITFNASSGVSSGDCISVPSGIVLLRGLLIFGNAIVPTGDLNLVGVSGSTTFGLDQCHLGVNGISAATYGVRLLNKESGSMFLSRNIIQAVYPANSDANGVGVRIVSGSTNAITYSAFVPNGTSSGTALRTSVNAMLGYVRIGNSVGSGFRLNDIEVLGGTVYLNNSTVRKMSGSVQFTDRFHSSLSGIHEAISADQCPATAKGAASQTANLCEAQTSAAAVQWAVGPTGQLKTNQNAAATTLGTVVGKIPYYDVSGTVVGYAPLYDAIT